MLLAFFALLATRPLFGGEDPLAPPKSTWHHENLTRKAADDAGWSGQAIDSLAFHADYVDSYLYNPLWWVAGGLHRAKVAIASTPELSKLHFDDLFAAEKVRVMWRRYLSGTVAGLLWAAKEPRERRVSLAHNIIGVGLHAIQDFYSHSNWIDAPERRTSTYFATNRRYRDQLPLWTAYYELPAQLGIKPHGKLLPLCKLFEAEATKSIMRVVCHAASPLTKSAVCENFRRCRTAVPAQPREVLGVTIPANVGYYEPGIAVDSHWQADIGAKVRELPATGAELFEAAYSLALETSVAWLKALDETMSERPADRGFWAEVKTTGKPFKSDTAPFEKFDQLPYTFLTAGRYPPPNTERGTEWYARVTITTSRESGAGTDADIHLILDGKDFGPLDYSPRTNPILGWSDFEAGDVASYVVGPLKKAPGSLALRNNAPTTLAVLEALGRDIVRAIVSAVDGIGNVLLSIIGGHADFVASNKWVMDAGRLDSLADGATLRETIDLNGRSEGHYRLYASVTPTGAAGADARGVAWRDYRVNVERLHCVKESEWDRGSSADEPFLCYLVIPHGGDQPMHKDLVGPFGDVDSGESRDVGRSYVLRIPRRQGFISVASAVFESDDETQAARRRLLNDFAGHVSGRTATLEKTFVVTLGEAVASSWRPERVQVVAFSRGATARVCRYHDLVPNRWIAGGESYKTTLAKSVEDTARIREPGGFAFDDFRVSTDVVLAHKNRRVDEGNKDSIRTRVSTKKKPGVSQEATRKQSKPHLDPNLLRKVTKPPR